MHDRKEITNMFTGSFALTNFSSYEADRMNFRTENAMG